MYIKLVSNIYFSSGPCVKYPDWNCEIFKNNKLNRTHINCNSKKFIASLLKRLKILLEVPSDFDLIFVPGSGSGAMACAFFNFFGERDVEVIDTGFFSNEWFMDLSSFNLNVKKVAHPGTDCDVVGVFVDTTSGYRYDNLKKQDGLVIIDAVSAIIVEDTPWNIVDVVAFSLQKVLGADGSIGVLAINKKAQKKLKEKKRWAVPRVFNINKWSLDGLVQGRCMSTPSMLALIELDNILNWAEINGGRSFLIQKVEDNISAVEEFMKKNDWLEFFINKEHRAKSVVCLSLKKDCSLQFVNDIALKAQEIGVFDIGNFALPAWRFWIGPTQEKVNVIEGLNRFSALFE